MRQQRRLSLALLAVLSAFFFVPFVTRAAEPGLNVAFWRTWARADRPVREGRAARTWMWGPAPICSVLFEEYDEATVMDG